jgi:hypothetical protein
MIEGNDGLNYMNRGKSDATYWLYYSNIVDFLYLRCWIVRIGIGYFGIIAMMIPWSTQVWNAHFVATPEFDQVWNEHFITLQPLGYDDVISEPMIYKNHSFLFLGYLLFETVETVRIS